jgi:hypothetical protein
MLGLLYLAVVLFVGLKATRLRHIAWMTFIMAVVATFLAWDMFEVRARFYGEAIDANMVISFWLPCWIGTFLASLIVYWLKRLMSEPQAAS